jgi:hypothetical protein
LEKQKERIQELQEQINKTSQHSEGSELAAMQEEIHSLKRDLEDSNKHKEDYNPGRES